MNEKPKYISYEERNAERKYNELGHPMSKWSKAELIKRISAIVGDKIDLFKKLKLADLKMFLGDANVQDNGLSGGWKTYNYYHKLDNDKLDKFIRDGSLY